MKKNILILTIIYSLIIYCILASVILIFYCNRHYKETNNITINNEYIKVNHSYFTSFNDQNELITKEQTFLIIDLDTNINLNNFILKIDNKYYENNNNYQSLFHDLAKTPLVFIVDNQNLGNNFFLYYQNKEKLLTRNYIIDLNPINLNYQNQPTQYSINDELILNDLRIKITNFEIKSSFLINYKDNNKTINRIINHDNKDILKLELSNTDNINIDKIKDYIGLKYTINNKEYQSDILLTKDNIINNNLYFIIDKNINNATGIYLTFTSRNQIYHYYLKK